MNLYAALLAASTTLLLLLAPILYRLNQILSPNRPKPRPQLQDRKAHILIILGSGGHTAEMLSMLSRASLDWKGKFVKRIWVVGEDDGISAQRAREFEEKKVGAGDEGEGEGEAWEVKSVPRARRIHQSVWTAPVSCLRCAVACFFVLLPEEDDVGHRDVRGYPDVILCNGPATATIMVLVSVVLRFFDLGGCHSRGKMRTVYVESWARVKRVSLSGRLLGWVVDRFLVQWEGLEGCCGGREEFVGVLV